MQGDRKEFSRYSIMDVMARSWGTREVPDTSPGALISYVRLDNINEKTTWQLPLPYFQLHSWVIISFPHNFCTKAETLYASSYHEAGYNRLIQVKYTNME